MSPHRLASLFRLLAALALLAAALLFFAAPLRTLAARLERGGNPLAGVFGPAPGFLARIDSRPKGASIRIDGRDRGKTPFLGNVACSRGEKIAIEIEAQGYQPWKRELECRVDGQLEISAQLSR